MEVAEGGEVGEGERGEGSSGHTLAASSAL